LACSSTWRWRRHVPPKRWLTFNGLHGVISQKIDSSRLRLTNPETCGIHHYLLLVRVCNNAQSISSVYPAVKLWRLSDPLLWQCGSLRDPWQPDRPPSFH
jgi:hypothetical protein